MTPRDFIFWLQGAFELGLENPNSAVVQRHCDLAIVTHGAGPVTPELLLVAEIRGAISMGSVSWDAVKARLHGMFEHVIDPDVEANTQATPEELDAAHQGRPKPPRPPAPHPPVPFPRPPLYPPGMDDRLVRC